MLSFYKMYVFVYIDGARVAQKYIGELLSEKTEEELNHTDFVDWRNLSSYCRKNAKFLPFSYEQTKRGKILTFDEPSEGETPEEIKERKEDLRLKIRYKVQKFNPPLKKAFEWHEPDKAIRYLSERGMKFGK